jgi:hypothetical protein
MTRSGTTVVAVIALAILGVGAALVYLNRPERRVSLPPGAEFPACKFVPAEVNPHCIDHCSNVPGFPPYTKFDTAREGTVNGTNSNYCCPGGTDLVMPSESCKVRPKQ